MSQTSLLGKARNRWLLAFSCFIPDYYFFCFASSFRRHLFFLKIPLTSFRLSETGFCLLPNVGMRANKNHPSQQKSRLAMCCPLSWQIVWNLQHKNAAHQIAILLFERLWGVTGHWSKDPSWPPWILGILGCWKSHPGVPNQSAGRKPKLEKCASIPSAIPFRNPKYHRFGSSAQRKRNL